MAKFEVVSKYAEAGLALPVRGTAHSAGYDLAAAEDTIVPSYTKMYEVMNGYKGDDTTPVDLAWMSDMTKRLKVRPTLVSTGMKCKLAYDEYLELSVRSSTPLKYWLVLANAEGVIDSDYYNNESNEGEIYLQLINLSPFDIVIHKGEKIGQGIIKNYIITEDDNAQGLRSGGLGSTTK